MSLAADWHTWLLEAIHEFTETRRVPPVVKIVLDVSHEEFFVNNVKPGPGDERISISTYPRGREREMVKATGGGFVTPRVVVVHPARVFKIDLLTDAPNAVPFGFQPAAET